MQDLFLRKALGGNRTKECTYPVRDIDNLDGDDDWDVEASTLFHFLENCCRENQNAGNARHLIEER